MLSLVQFQATTLTKLREDWCVLTVDITARLYDNYGDIEHKDNLIGHFILCTEHHYYSGPNIPGI